MSKPSEDDRARRSGRDPAPLVARCGEFLVLRGETHDVWAGGWHIATTWSGDCSRAFVRGCEDSRVAAPRWPRPERLSFDCDGQGNLTITPLWRHTTAPGDVKNEERRQDS